MRKQTMVLSACIILLSCTTSLKEGELITVTGRIPVEEMGVSLIHEHILVDFIGADSTGYHRWKRTDVVGRALPFLLEAKEKGVKTFIDCTPAYLGRDPLLLKEMSEKTGIHILTNTGYYGAVKNKYLLHQRSMPARKKSPKSGSTSLRVALKAQVYSPGLSKYLLMPILFYRPCM